MDDKPNDSINEQQISNDFIETLKSRDKRWQDVDLMIKLETELQSSVALTLVLDAVNDEAAIALEKIINADPTDTKLMISLQASIRRARIIGETLEGVRKKGAFAQRALESEGHVEPTN